MAPRPTQPPAKNGKKLRIAFVHPDLGIGGAERLVVDAALGLQQLGHSVHIYTSHHDRERSFPETRDGTLTVHAPAPPFPRAWRGKFHILLAHARQLHLTRQLLRKSAPTYDVYFVDQLSTCIPFLRDLAHTPVVFYCHFPDKLLAEGAYVEGGGDTGGLLKRMYRYPMDWLEEWTTSQADIILANSRFTARVFKAHFTAIWKIPRVVHPGINLDAYEITAPDLSDPDVKMVLSDRPTLLSLNRFEKKKNAALAIDAFALLRAKIASTPALAHLSTLRLVLAGGYDPRLEDNMMTLVALIDLAKRHALSYAVAKPSTSSVALPPFNAGTPPHGGPDMLFVLNFSTPQRAALLAAARAFLYTPANEHFGIGPVEGMVSGVPVLACDSGGPTESVLDPDYVPPAAEIAAVTLPRRILPGQLGEPEKEEEKPKVGRTGWLRAPEAEKWADALAEIVQLSARERTALGERARKRAREHFGMVAMARSIEGALVEAAGRGPIPGLKNETLWEFAALVVLLSIYLWATLTRGY